MGIAKFFSGDGQPGGGICWPSPIRIATGPQSNCCMSKRPRRRINHIVEPPSREPKHIPAKLEVNFPPASGRSTPSICQPLPHKTISACSGKVSKPSQSKTQRQPNPLRQKPVQPRDRRPLPFLQLLPRDNCLPPYPSAGILRGPKRCKLSSISSIP